MHKKIFLLTMLMSATSVSYGMDRVASFFDGFSKVLRTSLTKVNYVYPSPVPAILKLDKLNNACLKRSNEAEKDVVKFQEKFWYNILGNSIPSLFLAARCVGLTNYVFSKIGCEGATDSVNKGILANQIAAVFTGKYGEEDLAKNCTKNIVAIATYATSDALLKTQPVKYVLDRLYITALDNWVSKRTHDIFDVKVNDPVLKCAKFAVSAYVRNIPILN